MHPSKTMRRSVKNTPRRHLDDWWVTSHHSVSATDWLTCSITLPTLFYFSTFHRSPAPTSSLLVHLLRFGSLASHKPNTTSCRRVISWYQLAACVRFRSFMLLPGALLLIISDGCALCSLYFVCDVNLHKNVSCMACAETDRSTRLIADGALCVGVRPDGASPPDGQRVTSVDWPYVRPAPEEGRWNGRHSWMSRKLHF